MIKIENILMNRKKIYWVAQFAGWFAFSFVNIILLASFGKLELKRIPVYILLGLLGVFFTHIYRYFIIKLKWAELPLFKLIAFSSAASVIIAAVILFLLIPFEFALGNFSLSDLNPGLIIGNIFNIGLIVVVWSLVYFLLHFFENKQMVQIESLIWEAAVKDFELKTLKAQLNPHFMFNALNSIRALVDEDPKKAQTAITQLSNILRYSLRTERIESVPLEEEIRTIEDYLSLESIRFEERLRTNIAIDPKVVKIEIPPLMIQTLVENGIKHGISSKAEGGIIDISACQENDRLIVRIRNTGSVNEKALKEATGFGIQNTKQRLTLLYGENASFTIKNEDNELVLAELIIPNGGTTR
jgi:two-component sensor histidine kinase